jgi:molybdenum cofactor guanylyltransferase
MPFSVVILAGGRSSRMGRDKAWLPVDGQPLIAHQIARVRELALAEIFISGRVGTDYSSLDCPVLLDRFANAGPLAGIAAGLDAASAPLVLVLAVDLPHLTTAVLHTLLQACTARVGIVPLLNGRIEPLVAVYPKAAMSLALDMLNGQQRAARAFAAACQQAGLVTFHEMLASHWPCFANWNSRADLGHPRLSASN